MVLNLILVGSVKPVIPIRETRISTSMIRIPIYSYFKLDYKNICELTSPSVGGYVCELQC